MAAAENSPLVGLLGETLLRKQGEDPENTEELLKDMDCVMLYFSAHWCPPCRAYTPKLSSAYKEYSEKENKENRVAIVFISSDQNQENFDGYFGDEMSFYALPYSDRDRKDTLADKYGIQGIPTLVLLDGKGVKVEDNIRGKHNQYLK